MADSGGDDDDDDYDDDNYFTVQKHASGKQIMSKKHEQLIHIFVASHITQLPKTASELKHDLKE